MIGTTIATAVMIDVLDGCITEAEPWLLILQHHGGPNTTSGRRFAPTHDQRVKALELTPWGERPAAIEQGVQPFLTMEREES
jgi:hypothetical protein